MRRIFESNVLIEKFRFIQSGISGRTMKIKIIYFNVFSSILLDATIVSLREI